MNAYDPVDLLVELVASRRARVPSRIRPSPVSGSTSRRSIPTTKGARTMSDPTMADAAALDQIAAILGLHATDPENNPDVEVLADIVGYVQATGRHTDVPEGA